MKLNTANKPTIGKSTKTTFEGGRAIQHSNLMTLRRLVLSCLLWEDTFYVDGKTISEQIAEYVKKCEPSEVAALAVEARTKFKLRHVPLLLVREMAKLETHKSFVATTLYEVIERADELTEFLAIYWKDGKCPLSAQVKKGLAKAFTKFDEYALAKYNRDSKIKLRDVLFLVHPIPLDNKQQKLWDKLVENKLNTPDTWEVQLSAGKDKKETFERLLKEEKLGALALLRNLRNMKEAGCSSTLIFNAFDKMNLSRVLPMRFITAARHAPQWEDKLEKVLFKSLENREKLTGKTILLVDVSGSMTSNTISAKSELRPLDVALALGILVRELAEDVVIYSFSTSEKLIPNRRGFALSEAIDRSQNHGGTALFQSVNSISKKEKADRLIVITDEQSHDSGKLPYDRNYVINVGQYKNSIAYGKKDISITGWSDAVLDFILEYEKSLNID